MRGNLRWVSADRQDKHKFYRNLGEFHSYRQAKQAKGLSRKTTRF